MEKGIQRGETQEIPWRTDPGGLRQDTYSKAVKLTPGLQSPVLLKLGGRRESNMVIDADPVYSNVRGFQLAGEMVLSALH